MAPPLTIHLVGESTINRVAERGVLKATVTSTGASQETISQNVTETCNELRNILKGLAPKNAEGLAQADAPVTQFSMSGFNTNSFIPRDDNGKELDREYSASTKFEAIFRDFSKLGEITSMLFRMPYVQVDNTEWRLTAETIKSLGAESRKAALEDAIEKAKDYTAVLGKIPVAIEVTDKGSRLGTRTLQQAPRRSSNFSKQQVDGMALEPEDVRYRTEIEVKFQAE